MFVVREDQCPHPWPCDGHAGLQDTADNLAVRNYVEIVRAPLAGRPTKRRPLEQVVFLHSLFFLVQDPWCALADRPTSPIPQPCHLSSVCWLAIAYSRVGTGRTPSAVPSSSNLQASHLGSEPGLIAQSCRAFSPSIPAISAASACGQETRVRRRK
jgi:hypothetical protein